jgi:hypothetical protein
MTSVFPHFIADLTTLPWVAIIAVGGSLLLTIVVIIGGLIIAHHRQQLWHETARLALEKGQPLPTEVKETHATPPADRGPGADLRAGLICIGVGVGLFLFFDALIGRGMAYVGAIPGFIGVALVLYAILSRSIAPKSNPPAGRPPQS